MLIRAYRVFSSAGSCRHLSTGEEEAEAVAESLSSVSKRAVAASVQQQQLTERMVPRSFGTQLETANANRPLSRAVSSYDTRVHRKFLTTS